MKCLFFFDDADGNVSWPNFRSMLKRCCGTRVAVYCNIPRRPTELQMAALSSGGNLEKLGNSEINSSVHEQGCETVLTINLAGTVQGEQYGVDDTLPFVDDCSGASRILI